MPSRTESKPRARAGKQLLENEELRLRLAEAEQALEAIRTGQVDSLVVEGPDGPRIYRLEGATQSYRVLVESMNEGAATLRGDGTILYCNARLARMLGEPLQQVMGSSLRSRVAEPDRAAFDALLERARDSAAREELVLRASDGEQVPSYLSVSSIVDERGPVLCLVATDLREQKRAEATREFLGMLSHELRNPLAPIRSSAHVLRHAEPGSDLARHAQEVIERQTEHLTRLVDDLLDVTRIAHGKIGLDRERVELRELVRRTAEDLRAVVERFGATFRVDVPDADVWAHVDATRVAQAIGNLLQNAGKFTGRGESVTLSLERDGTDARVRVRDTGAGIDPALLPRVFDAFVQGDQTLARSGGGLGLGLALVKGIIELHGGAVIAGSAGVGRGAEFTLSFPLGDTVPARESPPSRTRRSGRRVLVVDDNVDAAETLAEALRVSGYVVDVAFDGPTAIEMVERDPPDVVLCDIGLPGMDGYEVVRRLRALGAEGMQLIAVSGYAQPADVRKAVEAGFDAHVAKPCDPEQIEQLFA